MSASFDPERSTEGRSRVRAWPSRRWPFLAFWSVASIAASAVVNLIPGLQDDAAALSQDIASNDVRLWMFVVSALVGSPVVETAILAVPVIWLRRYGIREGLLIVLSAGLLSLMHIAYGSQGFSVFPAFLVFAYAYVARRDAPHRDGFVIATAIHTINNVIPVAGLLTYRYFPTS